MQAFIAQHRFTRSLSTLAAMLVLAASVAGSAAAQVAPPQPPAHPGTSMKEEKPGLLKQATITPDEARKTALAQVRNGSIAEEEIEMEDGKLAYSFDIKVPGQTGIEEVLVDAKTGAVIAHEHESPKQQAAERAKDARTARTRKAPPPEG